MLLHRKSVLSVLMAATLGAAALSGCGAFVRESAIEKPVKTEAKLITNVSDLQDGSFYVYHDGAFQALYANNATFELGRAEPYEQSNRTLFYNEDWALVPTMYEDDTLVYCTTSDLSEDFVLERFEYVGGTMGIANLAQTKTGRYALKLEADTKNVDPNSDAGRLQKLGERTVIIDRIGGKQLRSGNISKGGCVIGLKYGDTYETEVYVGTALQSYKLKADTYALTQMEAVTLNDYAFLRSRIAKISIPQYMNSGYYFINGFGLFRYVKGDSYSAATDFNIPNVIPSQDKTDKVYQEEEFSELDGSEKRETFVLDHDGRVRVTVQYDASLDSENLPEPTARIISNYAAYTLSRQGDHTLSTDVNMKAGTYTLVVNDLYGRSCTYRVEAIQERAASPDMEAVGERETADSSDTSTKEEAQS